MNLSILVSSAKRLTLPYYSAGQEQIAGRQPPPRRKRHLHRSARRQAAEFAAFSQNNDAQRSAFLIRDSDFASSKGGRFAEKLD